MVDRETAERDTKRLATRLKFAALRQNAVVSRTSTCVSLTVLKRLTQIGQTGIASAEVVHRDRDAELSQFMQGRERRDGIGEHDELGNLELQTLRRKRYERTAALDAPSRRA